MNNQHQEAQRAAFEKWHDGIYQGVQEDIAWAAWQAASSPPAPTGDEIAEGCTPVDAKVLREANHAFAQENHCLREALRFYAAKQHFNLSDSDAWDTVSGENQNFWCDEAGTATVEDGTLAAMAVRGEPIEWEDDHPPVCPGEPEDLIGEAL